jgi:Ni/Co efflux regulator RcnB
MKYLMTTAMAAVLLGAGAASAEPPDSSAHHAGERPAAPAPRAAPAIPPGGQHGAPGGPPGGVRPGGGAPAYPGGARPGQGPSDYRGAARGGPEAYRGAPGAEGGREAPAGGYRAGQPEGNRAGPAEGSRGGPAEGQRGDRGAVRGAPNNYHPQGGAPGLRPGGARPRYDPQYFPRVFRPDHAFAWRGAAWRAQPGYYYRRWGYGERLPFGWYDTRWYIDDYYDYDLPVPPYGYEWVRVGPDALLVDLDDGTVVESAYGLFD